MIYDRLYQFTELGLHTFERVFLGQLSEAELADTRPAIVVPVPDSGSLEVRPFETSKQMARAVLEALPGSDVYGLLANAGLWAWLTYVMRDQLFAIGPDGRRQVKELHRWYPSDPNDWRKGQRHLVRMPVLLLASLMDDADHLLCSRPALLPEIREQLTSQQDMFNPTFQRVARTLYFDDRSGTLKRGAGGKGGGTPRRLAVVRKQLDVTWELDQLDFSQVMEKLPREFDRFRSVGRNS